MKKGEKEVIALVALLLFGLFVLPAISSVLSSLKDLEKCRSDLQICELEKTQLINENRLLNDTNRSQIIKINDLEGKLTTCEAKLNSSTNKSQYLEQLNKKLEQNLTLCKETLELERQKHVEVPGIVEGEPATFIKHLWSKENYKFLFFIALVLAPMGGVIAIVIPIGIIMVIRLSGSRIEIELPDWIWKLLLILIAISIIETALIFGV